ncbi:DNA repair protein RecN [Thermobrachium celere]|uniref:DNA repair protein RecN n=1 Tax=Thermobrachium celere DSM 8682 TaxID=941824 RepID=R7RS32_9CLOT|nr:DNA repair protein RecN [Thermobrachium celere]CDF58196.1 DNA repair protein RecN [Thermobrachium celere DSM 8682]
MLLKLRIKNFALIEELELDFSNGFNVLTGETGAGKSILIDSVSFLVGEKFNKEIIRTGSDFAFVEGIFEIKNEKIISYLKENGIEVDDYLILAREINQSNKSISRVNGRTTSVSFIREISKYLIDIHGQHEHQSLLDDARHIEILDSFCGEKLKSLKDNYKDKYEKIKSIEKDIERLNQDEQYRLRKIDLLKFQIQEIDDANLMLGEEEELTQRRDILKNAEKIYSCLNSAYKKIYDSEINESAFDSIGSAIVSMGQISEFDSKLDEIKKVLEEVYYKLEDAVDTIRDYRDKIEYNDEELNYIENRLDLINKLKRKYGANIEEVLSYYESIKKELEELEKSDEMIEILKDEYERLLCEIKELANQITNIRKSTAKELKSKIENELKYLGMERAIFEVDIQNKNKFDYNGQDRVEFLISSNVGEPLKPLHKVASGGEISRIMLAIKSVVADVDSIPILIFDEIDTGISGRTAQAVAEKMVLISKTHQILCVTHLPQIAAMGDKHFKIQKVIKNDKTVTLVTNLQNNERIEELARMLGGAIVTELTKVNAKEILDLADQLKVKIRQ